MNINKEKFIYDEFKQFYQENRSQLYIYQDLEVSGSTEYEVVIENIYQLKDYEQNKLSKELIKIMINVSNSNKEFNELNKFIESNPIILYYETYIKFLKNYLNYDIKFKEKFDDIVINLMMKSSCVEAVKLGIISSSCTNISNLSEILDIFAIHNDYMFYVVKCLSYLDDNDKIFELCQNSYGYGKVFCVMNLSCVNKKMRDWLIEDGCRNNVGILELLKCSFLEGDFLEYLKDKEYDRNTFEKILMYFGELLSEYNLDEIDNFSHICLNIIKIIEEQSGGIYSLYIITSIMNELESDLIYNDIIQDNYDKHMYTLMFSKCKEICKQKEWKDVVREELNNIEIEVRILISCMEKIKYKIKKKEFQVLFNRGYNSPILYKYAFTLGTPAVKKYILSEGINKLSIDKLLTGADNIKIDNLSFNDVEQICLFLIINYLKYDDCTEYYKEINIRALNCPIIETRTKAMINLKDIKELLNENDEDIIIGLISNEVIEEIRRGLRTLIPKKNEKDRRYIDIREELKLKPHVKDIYLITSKISGTAYVDTSEFADKLYEEDLIFLKREFDNIYDENAIIVTTIEGYVLGYIPKRDNVIIKNLMDNKKYIYGYVKNIDEDYNDIKIDLYLSYEDVLEEITDTLSLLTQDSKGYLQ
ncbi:MAG: DNA-binding protein [Clostridium butyricum]|nr:DNA-binding protein [Clostridium butyricum]